MSYTKTTLFAAAATLALSATTAHAGEMDKTTGANQTEAQIQITPNTEVLAAVQRMQPDTFPVVSNKGEVFLNHIVPQSELPDPTLELDTIDTYSYEYEGRVYTNKVVIEEK